MRSRVAEFQRYALPEVELKDEAWFREQLEKRCSEILVEGSDFKIICPFHADNSPSCGVNRWGGYYNCFSCNAGGGWNELAEKLGMEKLRFLRGNRDSNEKKQGVTNVQDEVSRGLSRMGIHPHRMDRKGEINRPLAAPWPEDEDWRGLPGSFLAELGCVQVHDLAHNIERIGLPIRRPDGLLVGYTCRAIDPEDAEPKYSPLSADRLTWRERELPAASSIFLIEMVLNLGWDRVVIVEGPADALRLLRAGIPAVAILGTGNWTKMKAAIILGLNLRVAFVMMDNDKAGKEAQPLVLDSLMSSMKAIGLRLPQGVKDPDQLSEAQLEWVRNRVLSY